MQSGISPDNWQKCSGLGIYESILNRGVLQICKVGYFSMIEGPCSDFAALYKVLKLERMVSGVLGTVGCCNHVYIGIFIQRKQIHMKFSAEFSNTVLCL